MINFTTYHDHLLNMQSLMLSRIITAPLLFCIILLYFIFVYKLPIFMSVKYTLHVTVKRYIAIKTAMFVTFHPSVFMYTSSFEVSASIMDMSVHFDPP